MASGNVTTPSFKYGSYILVFSSIYMEKLTINDDLPLFYILFGVGLLSILIGIGFTTYFLFAKPTLNLSENYQIEELKNNNKMEVTENQPKITYPSPKDILQKP